MFRCKDEMGWRDVCNIVVDCILLLLLFCRFWILDTG